MVGDKLPCHRASDGGHVLLAEVEGLPGADVLGVLAHKHSAVKSVVLDWDVGRDHCFEYGKEWALPLVQILVMQITLDVSEVSFWVSTAWQTVEAGHCETAHVNHNQSPMRYSKDGDDDEL